MHRCPQALLGVKFTFPSWSLGTRKIGGAGLRARQAVRTGWKACATGKTFQDKINVVGTEARPSGLFMIYGYPQAMSRRHRESSAIDAGRRI
jgi:hypothetical protein